MMLRWRSFHGNFIRNTACITYSALVTRHRPRVRANCTEWHWREHKVVNKLSKYSDLVVSNHSLTAICTKSVKTFKYLLVPFRQFPFLMYGLNQISNEWKLWRQKKEMSRDRRKKRTFKNRTYKLYGVMTYRFQSAIKRACFSLMNAFGLPHEVHL